MAGEPAPCIGRSVAETPGALSGAETAHEGPVRCSPAPTGTAGGPDAEGHLQRLGSPHRTGHTAGTPACGLGVLLGPVPRLTPWSLGSPVSTTGGRGSPGALHRARMEWMAPQPLHGLSGRGSHLHCKLQQRRDRPVCCPLCRGGASGMPSGLSDGHRLSPV